MIAVTKEMEEMGNSWEWFWQGSSHMSYVSEDSQPNYPRPHKAYQDSFQSRNYKVQMCPRIARHMQMSHKPSNRHYSLSQLY